MCCSERTRLLRSLRSVGSRRLESYTRLTSGTGSLGCELAHRREEQAAALLACDEQGLSAEFVVAGSASGGGAAKSSDASAAAAVALVAADRWLTHDEDVLAEVPQRTRRLATNHLAAVVSLGCLLRLHMVCMI